MNVYDFDHTIYPGDSTLDFWRYCFKRRPAALLPLPGAVLAGALFRAGALSREAFKARFYRFLRYVPDVERAVSGFWDKNLSRVLPWYLARKREDDLIISASPEFLILPACARLGVRGLASPVSPETGELLGPNCRGEEKTIRLRREFPDARLEEFFSDSLSDAPLARLAGRAWLVEKGTPRPWPQSGKEDAQ